MSKRISFPGFSVRTYRHGDFENINTLWQSINIGGSIRGDNEIVVESTLAAGGELFLLIEDDENKIIGTSWITHDSRRCYLHHFGIHQDYQGRRLSHLLMYSSLLFAKKCGFQLKIEVHKDNEIALNLYKQYGFKYLGDYNVHIIRNISQIEIINE